MSNENIRKKSNCPVCGETLDEGLRCPSCGFEEVKRSAVFTPKVFKLSCLIILLLVAATLTVRHIQLSRLDVVDGHYKLENFEHATVFVLIDDYPKWRELTKEINEVNEEIRILTLEKKDKFSNLEEERRIERLILNKKNALFEIVDKVRPLEKTEIAKNE